MSITIWGLLMILAAVFLLIFRGFKGIVEALVFTSPLFITVITSIPLGDTVLRTSYLFAIVFIILFLGVRALNMYRGPVFKKDLYPLYFFLLAITLSVFMPLFLSGELYHKMGGLNLQYQIVADRDFFIRAFRSGRVKTVKKELVYFRIHNDNLSTVRKNQALEENKIINNRLNAGPNTFKRRVLSFVGHFITKLYNVQMSWYKIKNQEFSIYS
jgi:hypothetical protein